MQMKKWFFAGEMHALHGENPETPNPETMLISTPRNQLDFSVEGLDLLHQLHRRARRVRKDLPLGRAIERAAEIHIGIVRGYLHAGVLDHHGGQIRAVTVIRRVIDDGAAATATPRAGDRPASSPGDLGVVDAVGRDGHRRGRVVRNRCERRRGGRTGSQPGQGVSQIGGVDIFVRRLLVAHNPSVRRAGWRADEEELLGVRSLQQLLASRLLRVLDGRVFAEVDAGAHAVEQILVLQVLANANGVVVGVEGAHDAPHGRERREGVQGRDGGDLRSDGIEGRRLEEAEVIEFGDQQSIRRRRGLG